MKTRTLRLTASLGGAVAAIAAVLAACAPTTRVGGPQPVDPQIRISQNMFPALRGTVGEFCAFVDANAIPVDGYGVVAGLPNTGSGEMDPRIREMLINRLVVAGVGLFSTETQDISPEAILASPQISAVEIRGVIPPLAVKGTTFDLYVNAVPNSRATSLANGLLWTSDLKVIGLTLDGNDSQTLALGRGPVFIPAALAAAQKGPDFVPSPSEMMGALRSGRVLGGGVCMGDRPARLQLYSPSYRVTAAIERTINARYPSRDKAALAQNDSIVSLRAPAEFRDAPEAFVNVVRHLYLDGDEPGFNEQRVRDIIDALAMPGTPHEDLGLALQGIGRIDLIQPYYTSPNAQQRFWCARAGACLHDSQAMAVLQEFLQDTSSPFRRQALLAMIEASRGRDTERTTIALMQLLGSNNTDDEILAYHGLLAIRSGAVTTYSVGRKFLIDIVPADSPSLIYVLEADSPRIALIGRPMALTPGALFISKDKLLTVSAEIPGDAAAGSGDAVLTAASLGAPSAGPAATAPAVNTKESVTLYWRPPLDDRPAVKLRSLPGLAAIVARATWIPEPRDQERYISKQPFIGATYQRITEMLALMCADKTLDAKFVAERAPDLILTPADIALGGRPEGSTLTPPAPPPVDPAAVPESGGPGGPGAPLAPEGAGK